MEGYSHRARVGALRGRYLIDVQQLKDMRPVLDELLKKVRKVSGSVNVYWACVQVYLYNISVPEVVEKVCGPIHRKYGVDWKMKVAYSSTFELTTRIPGIIGEHGESMAVELLVTEKKGEETCKIVRVKVGEYTEQEISYRPGDPKYAYKADCEAGLE